MTPMSWAAASLYSRHAPLPKRTAVSTAMQMLTGGVWMLLAGAATGELAHVDPSSFSRSSLGAVAYLIVFGSLMAFTAFAWLVRHAPMPLVATYGYVNPVVAVALGWLVLDEPITPRMLLAGAIIVGAVVLIANGHRTESVETKCTAVVAPSAASRKTSWVPSTLISRSIS